MYQLARWNSTFLILNVAQKKLKKTFDKLDEQDPYFKLGLYYKDCHVVVMMEK